MVIHLSGIAAKEIGSSEMEYKGKMTKKELLDFLKNKIPSLKDMKLEVAINSERVQTEDTQFSKADNILIFNAYAGG